MFEEGLRAGDDGSRESQRDGGDADVEIIRASPLIPERLASVRGARVRAALARARRRGEPRQHAFHVRASLTHNLEQDAVQDVVRRLDASLRDPSQLFAIARGHSGYRRSESEKSFGAFDAE